MNDKELADKLQELISLHTQFGDNSEQVNSFILKNLDSFTDIRAVEVLMECIHPWPDQDLYLQHKELYDKLIEHIELYPESTGPRMNVRFGLLRTTAQDIKKGWPRIE